MDYRHPWFLRSSLADAGDEYECDAVNQYQADKLNQLQYLRNYHRRTSKELRRKANDLLAEAGKHKLWADELNDIINEHLKEIKHDT